MGKAFIYIISNTQRTIFSVHTCENIMLRMKEHKSMKNDIYAKAYKCHYLMYYETYDNIEQAEQRMDQLKFHSRLEKLFIIQRSNPALRDLSAEW